MITRRGFIGSLVAILGAGKVVEKLTVANDPTPLYPGKVLMPRGYFKTVPHYTGFQVSTKVIEDDCYGQLRV